MFDAFSGFAGRLLSYTRSDKLWLAAAVTSGHQSSGLVLRGHDAISQVRRLRAAGRDQLVVVDLGDWYIADASAAAPDANGLSVADSGGLFPNGDVDDWAGTVINAGADVVLTRSLFVREADWEALRAVLRAGGDASRTDVMTLIATDASMLGQTHLPEFLRILADESGGRPLAFVFAGKNEPLARRDRVIGLRALLGQHPGSLLVGVDVLAATDAAVHGAGAAIGMTGSLRQPARPKDDPNSRGPAAGFVPGLFLRELWETRSPTVYADWYADSRAPTCVACGGRALDSFTNDDDDKKQVLVHNIHAWLAVLDEIGQRSPSEAKDWLRGERLRALDAHARLRPRTTMKIDRLLSLLCELDGPDQCRPAPTGGWP